jgi:hypothetical protein
MLRITVVRLLADIVNRYTLISKQKMYPAAAGAAAGYRVKGTGFREKQNNKKRPRRHSSILSLFFALSPGP